MKLQSDRSLSLLLASELPWSFCYSSIEGPLKESFCFKVKRIKVMSGLGRDYAFPQIDTSIIWEYETAIKKMPPSDEPVGKFVEHFLY